MNEKVLLAVGLCCLGLATRSDRPVSGSATPVQQSGPSPPPDPSQGLVFVCPMDPDVRSHTAGSCRRCGMTLVAGVPDPVEFHLDMRVVPSRPAAKEPAALQFLVTDPWKNRPVAHYNVIHERFFHAFVVSEDLEFFVHGHPALVADGLFQYPISFPKAGMYRVLGDFYPEGGTPQLSSQTVIVPGEPPSRVRLGKDYSTKSGANVEVSLSTIPDVPVAGGRTQMRFTVRSDRPLERYLGVWGHMLAVSDDLIDMMHEHPFIADGGPQLEFEVVFPRPGAYRVWIQLQSAGVVNTVHFDLPVGSFEE